MSLQQCFVCGLETACPEIAEFVTERSLPETQAFRVGKFARDAAQLGLYENREAVTMEAGITIDLPCGHCVHTKCLRQWVEHNSKCRVCGYAFPQIPRQNENIVMHLYRVFKYNRVRMGNFNLLMILWSMLLVVAVMVTLKLSDVAISPRMLSDRDEMRQVDARKEAVILSSLGITSLQDLTTMNDKIQTASGFKMADFTNDLQMFYEEEQSYIFDYYWSIHDPRYKTWVASRIKFLESHPYPPSKNLAIFALHKDLPYRFKRLPYPIYTGR